MTKDQTACKAIEITPAMIEAGVSAFREMVVGEDLDSEIVRHVFLRMVESTSLICCFSAKAASRVLTSTSVTCIN
jgi:hypothetical protein